MSSQIIDRQRFRRTYPFYKPRAQETTLGGTTTVVTGDDMANLTVQTGRAYGQFYDAIGYSTTPTTRETDYVVTATFDFDPTKLYAANGTRTMVLRVVAETTGPTATVRLYNVSTSTIVPNTTMTTASTTPVMLTSADLSADIGTTAAIYQLQMKMDSGGGTGDIINVTFASIRVEWS